MRVIPLTLREANAYVVAHHRHHKAVQGCKFAIGCMTGDVLHGVAIVGLPIARKLGGRDIVEVRRLCTDGYKNACSFLYSACARIAREMGYKKIITYILESESGTSLRASGWSKDDVFVPGGTWDVPTRPRTNVIGGGLFDSVEKYPTEPKQRYSKQLF